MPVLDLPVIREVDLVLVWTVHTLREHAQFRILEIQFVHSVYECYFRQDPLCTRVSGFRNFASASSCSFCLSKMILI